MQVLDYIELYYTGSKTLRECAQGAYTQYKKILECGNLDDITSAKEILEGIKKIVFLNFIND